MIQIYLWFKFFISLVLGVTNDGEIKNSHEISVKWKLVLQLSPLGEKMASAA